MFGLIDGFVGRDGYRFSRRALECWMGVFIAEIISITDQDLAGRDTPAFIAEIERFIDERLHADFSTDDIVTKFAMTERKLHYWFKKQFGNAPATLDAAALADPSVSLRSML